MSQVMIFRNIRPDIGLFARKSKAGKECVLVEQFIDYYCDAFVRHNKKTRLAIFIEPRIESGFPDVVFASYLPSIVDNWSDEREVLDINDLKLLSYLYCTEKAAGVEIISKLGFREKQTLTSLEKLLNARLISYRENCWRINKLRDVFSLTKLIAVEAKMNDISKVAEQTHLNTWFASHSYALSNSTSPQRKTISVFSKYGIGLYCKGSKFSKIVEAKPYSLPSSYISFQFNEWIAKAIAHQGVTSNA
jgi:hypothetical protein